MNEEIKEQVIIEMEKLVQDLRFDNAEITRLDMSLKDDNIKEIGVRNKRIHLDIFIEK